MASYFGIHFNDAFFTKEVYILQIYVKFCVYCGTNFLDPGIVINPKSCPGSLKEGADLIFEIFGKGGAASWNGYINGQFE
jgi:hypothetical protein